MRFCGANVDITGPPMRSIFRPDGKTGPPFFNVCTKYFLWVDQIDFGYLHSRFLKENPYCNESFTERWNEDLKF